MFTPSRIASCVDIIIICDIEDFVFDWNNPVVAMVADERVKSDWVIGYAVSPYDDLCVIFRHPAVTARAAESVTVYACDFLNREALNDDTLSNLN